MSSRSSSPRSKSPRSKSPRSKSPRSKSPRSKSPRSKSPRSKSPSRCSPCKPKCKKLCPGHRQCLPSPSKCEQEQGIYTYRNFTHMITGHGDPIYAVQNAKKCPKPKCKKVKSPRRSPSPCSKKKRCA